MPPSPFPELPRGSHFRVESTEFHFITATLLPPRYYRARRSLPQKRNAIISYELIIIIVDLIIVTSSRNGNPEYRCIASRPRELAFVSRNTIVKTFDRRWNKVKRNNSAIADIACNENRDHTGYPKTRGCNFRDEFNILNMKKIRMQ